LKFTSLNPPIAIIWVETVVEVRLVLPVLVRVAEQVERRQDLDVVAAVPVAPVPAAPVVQVHLG